jgi:hypothetical protein
VARDRRQARVRSSSGAASPIAATVRRTWARYSTQSGHSPGLKIGRLGTALTARHVRDAARRGCPTASLQSTAMAERVYAAVEFRDLGRIREYVP